MRAARAALLLTPSVAGAAEGMPQLDFANPLTLSQVVWLGIIFLAFYLLLSGSALPRVREVLHTRAERIETDLTTARTAKEQADQSTASVLDATRAARSAAQARIAEAVNQAKGDAAARAQADDERLNAQLVAAEARIKAGQAAAMGALRQVASETAGVVVQRLTGQAPPSATVDSTVGSVLAARGLG